MNYEKIKLRFTDMLKNSPDIFNAIFCSKQPSIAPGHERLVAAFCFDDIKKMALVIKRVEDKSNYYNIKFYSEEECERMIRHKKYEEVKAMSVMIQESNSQIFGATFIKEDIYFTDESLLFALADFTVNFDSDFDFTQSEPEFIKILRYDFKTEEFESEEAIAEFKESIRSYKDSSDTTLLKLEVSVDNAEEIAKNMRELGYVERVTNIVDIFKKTRMDTTLNSTLIPLINVLIMNQKA